MSDPPPAEVSWHPWRVAPTSGFEVEDPRGAVGLEQIDAKQFIVTRRFRFSDGAVQTMLVDRLTRDGKSPDDALRAVEDARTFSPTEENPTDLASIPPFMRWFVSSYGPHTLAAIIHDNLIVDEPNSGPLGSDTLSDRFFREMMRCAGVPYLRRWIMWAAVAMRSRWAVGGSRRVSVIVWLLLAVTGITGFVWALGSMIWNWDTPVDRGLMLVVAAALPFAAAVLWGRQFGAAIVAAVAALWILPPAVLAGAGSVVYFVLERIARLIRLR